MSKLKALWKKLVEFFTGKKDEINDPVFEEPVFGPTTPETAEPPVVVGPGPVFGPTNPLPVEPVETVSPGPVFGPTTPIPAQPVESQPVFGPTADVVVPAKPKATRKPRAKQAEAKPKGAKAKQPAPRKRK